MTPLLLRSRLAGLAAALLLGTACTALAAGRTAPIPVIVSVPPLAAFVERIGGPHVRVDSLVRPGENPHFFEPAPRRVTALADAELYVRTGMGFEAAWIPRIVSINPGMRILDARDTIAPRTEPSHTRNHEAEAHAEPHVWTSPPLAKRIAQGIRNALIELDAEHHDRFAANFAGFAQELDALDRELRALFAGLENPQFIVYHPAWGYFADTYGLTQIAIEHEGKEPGPRALAELIDRARREGIKLVLVQPQAARKAAGTVAQAIGGRLVTVDPLAVDYVDNIRHVARVIAEGNAS